MCIMSFHLILLFIIYLYSFHLIFFFFFFFNDTATTEIYTLSLHDALPIYAPNSQPRNVKVIALDGPSERVVKRSEEHTSELQSRSDLVCRLLLEKKKKKKNKYIISIIKR